MHLDLRYPRGVRTGAIVAPLLAALVIVAGVLSGNGGRDTSVWMCLLAIPVALASIPLHALLSARILVDDDHVIVRNLWSQHVVPFRDIEAIDVDRSRPGSLAARDVGTVVLRLAGIRRVRVHVMQWPMILGSAPGFYALSPITSFSDLEEKRRALVEAIRVRDTWARDALRGVAKTCTRGSCYCFAMPVLVRDRGFQELARAHIPIMAFFAIVMPIAALFVTGAGAALTVLVIATAYAVFSALLACVLCWIDVVSAEVDEAGVRGYRFGGRRFSFAWGDVSRASLMTPENDLLLWVPGYRCRFAISGDLPESSAIVELARRGVAAERWRPLKVAHPG